MGKYWLHLLDESKYILLWLEAFVYRSPVAFLLDAPCVCVDASGPHPAAPLSLSPDTSRQIKPLQLYAKASPPSADRQGGHAGCWRWSGPEHTLTVWDVRM